MLYLALQDASRRTADESRSLAQAALDASFRQNEASFWGHQVAYAYFNTVPQTIDVAKRALSEHRDNWEAWMWYADVVDKDRGSPEEARAAIRKAIALAPGLSIPLAHAANLEAKQGNWDAALLLASQAVGAPPPHLEAVLAYAAALSHKGRCTEARIVADRLVGNLKTIPDKVARAFRDDRATCERRPE
jgi:Flp pilus assembly protein TadD